MNHLNVIYYKDLLLSSSRCLALLILRSSVMQNNQHNLWSSAIVKVICWSLLTDILEKDCYEKIQEKLIYSPYEKC